MKGIKWLPLVLILSACTGEKTQDINSETTRLGIIKENHEKSMSKINTDGLQVIKAVETRNLDELGQIDSKNTIGLSLKLRDYIDKIEAIEQEILEEENDKVPPSNDYGDRLYEIEEKSLEDVKGTLEYYEFFDKDNGSVEQYFLYTNINSTETLSVIWLGDEIYAVH